MRYALHADVDLLGAELSAPIDLNLFSITIGAERSRFPHPVRCHRRADQHLGPLAEPLARGRDGVGRTLPVDRGREHVESTSTPGRLLFSLANFRPSLGSSLVEGDVSGWFTGVRFSITPSSRAPR